MLIRYDQGNLRMLLQNMKFTAYSRLSMEQLSFRPLASFTMAALIRVRFFRNFDSTRNLRQDVTFKIFLVCSKEKLKSSTMFPSSKAKPFTTPSHRDSFKSNSRKKFTKELRENELDLCNRSFDTAQNLLNKSDSNLRQTTLRFRNQKESENDANPLQNMPSTSKRSTATVEYFLMPKPEEKSINLKRPLQEYSNASNGKSSKNKSAAGTQDIASILNPPSDPMSITGRDKRIIMGRVDFCLKMHKLYPNLNILWDVYGKVIRVLAGNIRGEYILLLRTVNDRGPVIQSIYYDFNNNLDNFPPGTCLRAVGEFLNENRLRTFKLEQIDCAKYESALTRIQNVTSFSLLQSNIQNS